ncbi:MAG: RNB domain-containing ribonuclease [Candidatus Binatia bacterium]
MAHRHADLHAIAWRAMLAYGLEPAFPPAALAEVATMHAPASDAVVADQRALLWFSIDNDDSRDLDQLTVAERLPSGAVRLQVAIADVDALVAVGSAVDGHARRNTTSVYTAAQIFPMLPERLSTDLTSLSDGEDRLAVITELDVDDAGTVLRSTVLRGLVHNHAKLAYDSVAAWLDGTGTLPEAAARVTGIDAQLRLQDGVAQALRQVRHEHGALDLETIEPKVEMQDGKVVALRPVAKNRARMLIEDVMIAANSATAHFLAEKKFPSVRRVIRSPRRWDRLVALAATFGTELPAAPDAPALESFLVARRLADPLRFPDLSLTVVKLLGAGEYVAEAPGATSEGHFGLAVRDYVHSTAPNRRYPDLVTQRLLKAAITGTPSPYGLAELQDIATRCTVQENAADKVERQVRKSAAALLLSSRIGAHFDAIVTGASAKGTWARALHPPVEGRIVHGFEGLDVGDRVGVKLASVDVDRGFIDFVR